MISLTECWISLFLPLRRLKDRSSKVPFVALLELVQTANFCTRGNWVKKSNNYMQCTFWTMGDNLGYKICNLSYFWELKSPELLQGTNLPIPVIKYIWQNGIHSAIRLWPGFFLLQMKVNIRVTGIFFIIHHFRMLSKPITLHWLGCYPGPEMLCK